MNQLKDYWDRRFKKEGMIWGQEPSKTAFHAKNLFLENHVKTVLVPGSGYGRNTKALSPFFGVEGIELSHDAIMLAREWDPKTRFVEDSALSPRPDGKRYDAVYCYDLLHLLLQPEREMLVEQCARHLRVGGLMYFTSFSDEDSHNGMGKRIEDGTYEYTEGKYAHFFSEQDLIDHFTGMQLLETGSIRESLTYQDQSAKEYILRYIIVRKN
ncbi:class I SAM-dependent methyltransferase [Paenibacillus puldeungensis]|uniref:Class I SAM-dependent methyltransferase n=1 Tax=Paenibacillus puldeungensis TaxID=696536 RepID=A0ABW3S1V5_9BACL